MVHVGSSWKNYPALCVLFKAGNFTSLWQFRNIHARISMVNSCCGSEQNRSGIFFRILECFLNHLISLFRTRRIKHRKLGEFTITAGILLRLTGNWSRVIGRNNYHSSFNANIGKAHYRIAGNIESNLFHCNKSSCSGITCTGCNFYGSLFIYRPFNIGSCLLSVFCNILYDF